MIKSLSNDFFRKGMNLVSGVSEGRKRSSISAKTSKIAQKILRRVIPLELENAYYADPITFNSVNKNVQMIMSAGYRFDLDEADKDNFMEFINSLGKIRDPITIDELFSHILWARQVFGYAWLENVFNEEMTDILDLSSIDPKQMDYARDSTGNVVLDTSQRPIGYVQSIGNLNVDNRTLGDKVPEGYKDKVDLSNGGVFILPERISLFKLYTGANGFDSYGLIEPAYKSILRKLNIEEAQTNSIYARGTFPLVDYVGNEKTPATPQRLEQALEIMKKFRHDRYFALPFFHRIEPVEVKQSDIVDSTLKHLRENQAAAFGMPLAFAAGTGEAVNRSTLNSQQRLLEFTLNDMVTKMILDFEKQILTPLAKLRNYKRVPKIIWNKIGTEDWDEKSERLFKWVELGVISPSEKSLRNLISKQEGIELTEIPKPVEKKEKIKLPKEVKEVIENARRNRKFTI